METNEDYYISRNALLEHFDAHVKAHQVGEIERDIWFAAYEDVDNFDLTDVAPVVHAHWWYNTFMWENDWHCSRCDGWVKNPTTYCPHCGAMMDERGK